VSEDLVAIARVAKPRGLKGEVVAEVLTDFPQRFDDLEDVIVLYPNGTRTELKIERSWFHQNRIVLKFSGVDSIESAEPLRGAEVCVQESDAIGLEDGAYYDWELEGCLVETADGEHIGKVRELMRTGGTENLVVDNEGKEHLIPFAESICTEVDVEGKRIVVDLPEGLLEF
jgi:16S rRNA processing protein RimM